MGVKPKNRKVGARASIEIQTKDKIVRSKTMELDYPTDGSPHSTVGTTLGMRCSKPGTYSSATCEIHVSVPCTPGNEEVAGVAALDKAQKIYQEYSDEFDKTVESL